MRRDSLTAREDRLNGGWRCASGGLTALLFLALIGAAGLSRVLFAGAGQLDPGFGSAGIVTTDFLSGIDQAFAIAIQADGRVVAGGRHGGPTDVEGLATDFALARYHADGSLDPGFGTNGRVLTDFGGNDAIRGVAIQTDGKVVAAGTTSGSLALARYDADGSLDVTFGPHLDGKVVSSAFAVSALALQADGRIVVAGTSGFDFAVACYNTDGSQDVTFGAGLSGRTSTDFGHTEFGTALAIQPADGRIVVAGSAQNPSTGVYQFAVARYNTNGSLDSSFGNQGTLITPVSSQSFANAVAVQPNGKIVVAGSWADLSGGSGFALTRYNMNGTLDTTFGIGGVVKTVRLGTEARALAIQSDGRIVAAGASRFLLIAYNADGSPDLLFGPSGDGVLVTDFGGGAQANALVLQTDGKLLAAGSGPSRVDFAVVRYDMTRPIIPNHKAVLDVGFSSTVSNGQRFGRVGRFTDPDSTSWTATVDYGDGTGLKELPIDGMTFFLNHGYAADGRYTITVCVTDDAGDTACSTIGILVSSGLSFGVPACVHDVPGQFGLLKLRGEALGFHLGDGTPDPTLSRHYQGMVRRPGSGTPYFFITRSGKHTISDPLGGDDPGNLLVVRFDSRNTTGERMRSNRLPAHNDTEDTPPPPEDRVVLNINFNGGADRHGHLWPSYRHPGAMQIFEDVLVIPLEAPEFDGADPKVEIALADIRNLEEPILLRELELPGQDESAGVAAIIGQAGPGLGADADPNGHLLLLVPGANSETLHVYKSNTADIRAENLAFSEFAVWNGDDLIDGEWPTDHDVIIGPDLIHASNQSLFLVDDCVGGLYLLATRNSAGGNSFAFSVDHAALYRVSTGAGQFGLRKVDDLHITCESDHVGLICDLAAAAGFYVSPAGELLLYASEHENTGPNDSVKMAEFHNRQLFREQSPNWAPTARFNPPALVDVGSAVALDGSPSLPPVAKPWAEMYADENFDDDDDRSMVLDWDDRLRAPYARLDDLDDWDDDFDSVIFVAPRNCDLHLYDDPHFTGPELVLPGTRRVEAIANLNADPYDFGDKTQSVQFVGSTCEADAMTYSWDLDDDGTFETSGVAPIFHPASTTRVALRVCGAFGPCDEEIKTIEVRDLRPVISSFEVPQDADEGADVAAALTIDNPGERSVTVTVDWGDGVSIASDTPSNVYQHRYGDNGFYTVGARLCDTAGNCDASTAIINVKNVAPVVSAGADATISEGAAFSRSVGFSDAGFTSPLAGTIESFSATVDWGDGTIETVPLGNVSNVGVPTSGLVPASHSYADNGVYTLTVTVSDDDHGIGVDTVSIHVNNVAPVVRIGAVRDETGRLIGPTDVALAGLRVDVSGTFTDAGTRDTHSATISWGDTTSSAGAVVQARREVTGSHAYTASSASLNQPFHNVRLTVTDDDGGAGFAVAHLTVVDPSGALVQAVSGLQTLANQPTVGPAAGRALSKAIDELQGANGGNAHNGATDKLAGGSLEAALEKIGLAVQRLEAAQTASPSVDVAGFATLLVLTAKAVAVDAIARAQLLAIRPNIVTAVLDANTLVAAGDALLAIGKNAGAVDKYGDAVRRVQHFL